MFGRQFTARFGFIAAGFLFLGAGSASAQVCRDRPFIVQPSFEKALVERVSIIRPIIQKAVIESPQFIRPMRERPLIQNAKIEKPLFDWCGDLVVPLDPEASAPRVGRSLRDLISSGRITKPGSSLKQSYLAAVRAKPEEEEAAAPQAAGSCCGDAPAPVSEVRMAKAMPRLRAPQYRDQPPPRFPMFAQQRSNKASSSKTVIPAAAPAAAASAIGAATMIVPRGSR